MPTYQSPDILFEQRLALWQGESLELRRRDRKGETRMWRIWVTGDRYFVQHGLLEGEFQLTNTQGREKNKGRSNYISAEEDALAEARREAHHRWDYEGYDQYVEGLNIDCRNENLNLMRLLVMLAGCFCIYKPSNNLFDLKTLLKLARKGQAFYSEKRDGLCFLVVIDPFGTVVFYSRRARPYMDKEGPTTRPDGTIDYSTAVPWTARFPHLVAAIQALCLPPGTLLACELVAKGADGRDSFKKVISYTKSLTPQSLADQAAGGLPGLYIWDVIFYNSQDFVSTQTVLTRWDLIEKLCSNVPPGSPLEPIIWSQFGSPEEALEAARLNRLEGYVVVDPDAVYGDRGWNLRGKPDRPSTCGKLKPKSEDDFVLMWDPANKIGTWGKGRHEGGKLVTLPSGQEVVHGGVGSVGLFQYNSEGQAVYCCDCSTGMDYELQAGLTAASFPFIAQIEFVERSYESEGDGSNALRHPVFLRPRPDKEFKECINDRL